jgi:hypothetical protein
MRKNITIGRLLHGSLMVLVVATLAACSKQPPDCTSSDMGKTIAIILMDDVVEALKTKEVPLSQAGLSLLKKYADDLRIKFDTTVELAHDKNSKTRVCQGKFTVKANTGATWDVSAKWQAQVTSDGKDAVVVLSDGAYRAEVANALRNDMNQQMAKEKNVSDLWGGRMICPPIQAAQDQSMESAGYSQFVVFKIDGTAVYGERKTPSGMLEKYKGNVDFLTDTVDFYIELLNENDKPVDVFRETAKFNQNKIFLNRTFRYFDKQGNPTQTCTHEITKGQSKP